jgi:2Fe-2S ferredoxin
VLDAREVQATILNSVVRTFAEGDRPAICATGHVYVAEGAPGCTLPWSENKMPEFTACERRPNGRLSCQLVASPGSGRLVVHLMDTRV